MKQDSNKNNKPEIIKKHIQLLGVRLFGNGFNSNLPFYQYTPFLLFVWLIALISLYFGCLEFFSLREHPTNISIDTYLKAFTALIALGVLVVTLKNSELTRVQTAQTIESNAIKHYFEIQKSIITSLENHEAIDIEIDESADFMSLFDKPESGSYLPSHEFIKFLDIIVDLTSGFFQGSCRV
jgi:hypothetical protein